MSLSIRNGILWSGNAQVRQVRSRNTGGAFKNPPKIAVIHFTAGASALSSAQWFASRDNTNSSAHVVIERDGSIIQCVPFDVVAWHAGKSTWRNLNGLNAYSIGIELANWGNLHGSGNDWYNAAGQKISSPFIGVHRNGNPDGTHAPIGWEPYPVAQFEAAVALGRALAAEYPIDEIVGHDDVAPVRKSDPGPAFNMSRLRERVLRGRDDDGAATATVSSPAGLNLRSGAGVNFTAIQLLPDKTKVHPLAVNGLWVEVSVLDAKGKAVATGWVHSRYLDMN